MDQEATSTKLENSIAGVDTSAEIEEAQLIMLLSSLRVESTPEANFEERFLYNLHERIEREAVCRPARTLLWEHISQFVVNFSRRRRLALGTTTACAFALCSAYLAWTPGDMVEGSAEVALTNRLESTLSSLKPGVAKDVTRISVERRPDSKATLATPSALRTPTLFAEAEDSYESSAYSRTNQPVNMGLSEDESMRVILIEL